jgi:ankyrin repeat protein
MKTKHAKPIPTAFPTCGEVFHYLIAALDLTAWADAFHDSSKKRRRDPLDIKAVSDQLQDWANEEEGRAPSRGEFEEFIRDQLRELPRAKDLAFVLCCLWRHVLDDHVGVVRENATYLDREGTRAWAARIMAPRALYFLWALQKFLQRVDQSNGPMLHGTLDNLLARVWPDLGTVAHAKHPLHLVCYKHYAELRNEDTHLVDMRTIAAWESGEDCPSCDALGRHFSQFHDKLGLLLNFAFAGLLEALANALPGYILPADWSDCRQLLLRQAGCVHCLDEAVAQALAHTPSLSLPDYERLLADCLTGYVGFLSQPPRDGVHALDPRVAKFRVYEEYQHRIAQQVVPSRLREFCFRLQELWRATALKAPQLSPPAVEAELAKLRAEHPDCCGVLAGPLLAIEARLALCHEAPDRDSLQSAFSLYQEAFDKSRYQAGMYTARIMREALGLAAMLHRRESGGGSIKPWIKKVLAWWDLLELGKEFNHEQLEQRIELAESRLTDELNANTRSRLKSALPQLGLTHWNIGGLFGFTELDLVKRLHATQVDRRQRKPMSTTVVGREQTALMEAIDRGQLAFARELVSKGANLNFINSTGDTCVTKALARKDYDLVLEILCRDDEPIRRETLLRVTTKMRISGLEQTISHGQVEILREMSRWKNGRGDTIDMDVERIWGQTPLYYAVNCLFHFRAGPREAAERVLREMATPIAKNLRLETLEAAHSHLAKDYNPDGVLKCIGFLINELHVDVNAPNVNDYTALTCVAECRMHDVAAMLLAAGANVNHRFLGGGTALVHAIRNDDYEMAKLLLEHYADYRLFVDSLGRPIYKLDMSEKMRRLIPHHL